MQNIPSYICVGTLNQGKPSFNHPHNSTVMKLKRNLAVSDSGFLFNPLSGESFSLNPMGITLFQLLKEEADNDSIRNHIMSTYDVDEATFEKDFQDFIGMLQANGLME